MPISDQERQSEDERLQHTIDDAERLLARVREQARAHRQEVDETRGQLWLEGTRVISGFDDALNLIQQEKAISERARAHAADEREIVRLERLIDSPYFGRVDFAEAEPPGQRDAIYVGRSSLPKADGSDFWVYDWRAPISSLFYDAEPGPAAFTSAAGTIAGEVTLKRQYKIRDGKLLYAFDTGVTIDDEMLQEVLSKSADSRMQSIVTTIQREQNRVIRDEAHPLLIVQGPAGSGKTSVALHRIAYLLYHHRDELSAENFLVLSPNPIFSAYINEVLPELGEANMLQTTFMAYAWRRLKGDLIIEDAFEAMERLFAANASDAQRDRAGTRGRGAGGEADDAALAGYKASAAYLKLLQRRVAQIGAGDGIAFADAVHDGEVIASADELRKTFHEHAFLPVAKRLEKLQNRVDYLLEPRLKELREQFEAELRIRPEYSSQAEIRWEARNRAWAIFQAMRDRLAAWTRIDPLAEYRALWRDTARFAALAREVEGEASGLPAGFEQLRERTLAALDANRLPYEDVAPLLYLKDALEGPVPQTAIRHVVVDEAQDYSPCHYAVLRGLFPHARFSVVGDLNQRIHPRVHLRGYEELLDVFGRERAAVLRLERSYRSTAEIVAFTLELLRDGEPVLATLRSGPRPVLTASKGRAAQHAAIARELAALQADGMQSIAVICKTAAEAKAAHAALRKTGAHLVSSSDADLKDGVLVIPSYLAKGLEFDAVVIYDAAAYRTDGERRALYTACTRALHRLHVHRLGEAPLLAGVDPATYSAVAAG
ncbi:MAG TPA: UvrD-helicase domain-containing protein [Limnochordia bacterium]|nr:UvrD-helicase domain-containing protein [Limnochordia bacterium]